MHCHCTVRLVMWRSTLPFCGGREEGRSFSRSGGHSMMQCSSCVGDGKQAASPVVPPVVLGSNFDRRVTSQASAR